MIMAPLSTPSLTPCARKFSRVGETPTLLRLSTAFTISSNSIPFFGRKEACRKTLLLENVSRASTPVVDTIVCPLPDRLRSTNAASVPIAACKAVVRSMNGGVVCEPGTLTQLAIKKSGLQKLPRDMRPQLLRAIDLISAKEAERRVFMLENPGLPGSGYITSSLYCGLQVIKPSEIAPVHRHSPNALRFIIEGQGAYTTVEGERVTMHPGDLIILFSGSAALSDTWYPDGCSTSVPERMDAIGSHTMSTGQ